MRPLKTYKRVCAECGDIKEVTYKPKSTTLCGACRSKKLNVASIIARRWEGHTPVRYWYFCSNCPSVREVKVRHRSVYCADCSRRLARKPKVKGYFDLKTLKYYLPKVRHFRVCEKCGDVKEVKTKQSAQKKLCRSCSLNKKVKGIAYKTKRKTRVSKLQIEQERERNRQHREAMAKAEKPKKPKLSDEEMIANYLKTNKVTVIEPSQYTKEV